MLEALVPADSFFRHAAATLDPGFVPDWADGCYADRGRPRIEPVVVFKLRLAMSFEGIRCERKLTEIAGPNLVYR